MIFIDVNVFVLAREQPTGPAGLLIDAIGAGRIAAATSTAALEELWHLELRGRPPRLAGLTLAIYDAFRPLLPVEDGVIGRALDLELPADSRLGSNDRVHAATCLVNGITQIVTADTAFDEIAGLERIDPLEPDQISKLLV